MRVLGRFTKVALATIVGGLLSIYPASLASAITEKKTEITENQKYCYTLGNFTSKTYLNYVMGVDQQEMVVSIKQLNSSRKTKTLLIGLTKHIYSLDKSQDTVKLSFAMESECLRAIASQESIKLSFVN